MGLFDKQNINESRVRCIAKGVKLCKITDVFEGEGKAGEDGKPQRHFCRLTLALQEEAKDTDNDVLPVGFPKEIVFGWYDETGGDEKLETTNRLTFQRIRELIVAAIGMPASTKDVTGELAKMGGVSALKLKDVLVAFSYKNGNQNVDQFISPAAGKK